MTFTEDDIKKMYERLATIESRRQDIVSKFLKFQTADEKLKEFIAQGFSRRVTTLSRCIENIFSLLPPEITKIPSKKSRKDAEINLQAFVINLTGCLDNLAWICVLAKKITNSKGTNLSNSQIGLEKNKKYVRQRLSSDFLIQLDEFEDWLNLVSGFRNALAHRIPLYIPPYAVTNNSYEPVSTLQTKISEMKTQMFDSILDPDKFWKISSDLKQLEKKSLEFAHFRPSMIHSFGENSPEILFHPKVLADFAAIEQISESVLKEISK